MRAAEELEAGHGQAAKFADTALQKKSILSDYKTYIMGKMGFKAMGDALVPLSDWSDEHEEEGNGKMHNCSTWTNIILKYLRKGKRTGPTSPQTDIQIHIRTPTPRCKHSP
eukprot:scaffold11242_cov16-Tisochrysis_lutea.AAC.1